MSLPAGKSEALSDTRRFQFLIEALSDYAITMLDPAGFVASWNSGAQRITGYRSGEITRL